MFSKYERKHINDLNDLKYMYDKFKEDMPKVMAFDTETTGLHIIYDKPFLIQVGWFNRIFTFYPSDDYLKVFFYMAQRVKYLVGHNIGFDLHMLINVGWKDYVFSLNNLYDLMHIARLSLEAIPAREGGDSLALKELAVTYLSPKASESEAKIKKELDRLNAERIKVLTASLKQFPLEGELTASGRQKYWGKGTIEKFLKDPTHDVDDLPADVRDVWLTWQEEYPEPTYEDVDREIMIRYGADDVILTLELFKKFYPIMKQREQEGILTLESQSIQPVIRMERVGLRVDMDYLEQSRLKVKNYIKKLRTEMIEICGQEVTVGQHILLRQIFDKKFDIVMENAQSRTLKSIEINDVFPDEARRLAQIIQKLRSLEKWYSTYIMRILENAKHDGKVYTRLNTAGAVSGRMSSDLQQFPKKALTTLEGDELFHPRKAFIVHGGKHTKMAYIDFDQIELVTQAHYTLLVSGGDLNLCRAYMPFKCHTKDGEKFDYKNIQPDWKEKDWYLDEAPDVKWTPTDVHAETTHNTLMLLGYECLDKYKHYRKEGGEFGEVIDEKEFKSLRGSKGKPANFAKNYGVGVGGLVNNLDVSYEVAQALFKGYDESFPHVITYQKMIEKAHSLRGYVQNHYGRRYYIRDSSRAYKLANYVIQGTCADALKKAIIELDKFLMDKESLMVLPVHDEVMFAIAEGEEWIIPHLMKIMENAFDWCLIPVSVGVDVTEKAWSEKEEYDWSVMS